MFQENIPLTPYSNYKIGGPARHFFSATDVESVLKATEQAKKLGLPIFILGGGTNLLISDKGFPGLVLHSNFKKLSKNEELITVGAGVSVKELLEFCIEHELSGLEWAGGLPGTVGGAVWGNAGAFKGEMKDAVVEVVSVDISSSPAKVIERSNAECEFGYRSSIFKAKTASGFQEVIVEIVLKLKKGDREAIRAAIQERIDSRISRQPLEYPNIGSMFKNVDWNRVPKAVQEQFAHKLKTDPFPVLPTAVLINAAGLSGTTVGGAQISTKHPNFIVNINNAKDSDVKELLEIMKRTVKDKYGIELEQEVIFV